MILFSVFLIACNELEKPKPEPFYAETAPPPKQEFRWSNGKMPKSFDPAAASAPPETDIVRAIYDGLTETDPKSLAPVPAIAARWTASEDFKTWTFYLRKDAKWSNGDSVTASDFVRSWQRLASLGEKVQQRKLLKNIIGMDTENVLPVFASEDIDFSDASTNRNEGRLLTQSLQTNGSSATAANVAPPQPQLPQPQEARPDEKKPQTAKTENKAEPKPETKKEEVKFGVEAVDNYTLKVSLVQPDKDFPALVAHPIFRPVHGDGKEFEAAELNAGIVTNGAFRVFSIGRDGVTLDRAEYYWNRAEISLERVRFVPTESAETALESYRAGEIDAITNANFEPLALKLLTPYDDFRRTKHSALNFYEFNLKNHPFSDRRVREALAIAIERERLTEDEMDGATEPALNYLPFQAEPKLAQDVERAKTLLAEAGFPESENFPVVRLLINRNDLQRRIARSVARMWEKNLNVKTEIIVRDGEEFEAAARSGDFDLIRRGIVLPTTDETTNMLALFSSDGDGGGSSNGGSGENEKKEGENGQGAAEIETEKQTPAYKPEEANQTAAMKDETAEGENAESPVEIEGIEKTILTEEQAFKELPAIPLYFPTSYSLVKPYVQGFETNVLDAPSLKSVKIDNNWQPANRDAKSKR
ncbi:MAG: peptide ABC transporter substrate-binding protein [Acidobacteriota bacterium]|nr:peptide ABC transporter substrate-binding protein [Acidobacteriota bacterium]